jgi:SAM-dependent methyltransferase
MPDEKTLARMYGPDYGTAVAVELATIDEKEPHRVVEWLKKERPGTFIDYGCGEGNLLVEAAKLNWQAIGIEFDNKVAEAVAKRTGARVFTPERLDPSGQGLADVLHLGDVIEHLTALNRQMPEILKLIKPGGLLLAQGPLEGNTTLFNLGLRLARTARPRRRTEMAPYHVMLATARGQRALFERFGLQQLEFSMSEVSWPAPGNFSSVNLGQPRSVSLYLLRRLSQAATGLRSGKWGNRYFYAGRCNHKTRV